MRAQHFGKIDVVIANAGIATTEALEHMAPETFERTIDINLTGVFRTFRAAIPYVKQTQGIFTGSVFNGGFRPLPIKHSLHFE